MSQSENAMDSRTAPPTAPGTYDLVEVAEAMRSLSLRVAEDPGQPLDLLVTIAVERVPGARWASVSMVRAGRFTTAASTDDRAVRADLLQYELGTGPCVDAVLHNSVYVTGDVRTEPRWIEWGQRASAEVGVNSVLSQRLHHQHRGGVLAGLNIYFDAPAAFDRVAHRGRRRLGVASQNSNRNLADLGGRPAVERSCAVRSAGRGRGSVRGRPACPGGSHHRRAR